MPTIRKAELKDAYALLEVVKSFTISFSLDEQAFHRSLSELLTNADAFLAVAEDQGRIIGYVLGFDYFTFYANGRVAWVEEITVLESYRLNGIGSLLMGSFEAWSRTRSAKLIALATRRAAAFYRALGYEESATYFRKLL